MREVTVEAHDFTGRTHFRTEQNVNRAAYRCAEPLERQDGFLDRHLLSGMNVTTVTLRQQQPVGTLLGDGFANHDTGRSLGEGHTRSFGRERDGTRGARVRFDNVQRVGHERVLHVNQATHTAALGDGIRAFTQATDLIIAQRARRQSACRVTGMHAGLLDMLHDAADIQFFAVEQSVHVDFNSVLQELIDEQRGGKTPRDDHVGFRLVERSADILLQLVVVVHDFHAATAEHIARTDQHRVADVVRGFTCLVQTQGGSIARRVHMLLAQHFTEQLTVFSQIDGFRRCTQNRDARSLESRRQGQRGLAAELDDHTLDRPHLLLGLVDLEHIFEGQRLEIQPVGHVVIGGHGFRVAVDHDSVIVFAQLLDSMHASVIELNALTDAVRTRAENDHGFTIACTQFGLISVAGVIVRCRRIEFRGARVHSLVHRTDTVAPTQFADGVLTFIPKPAQMRDLHVGETGLLRLAQHACGQGFSMLDVHGGAVDQGELFKEPRVDLGGLIQLLDTGSAPQRPHNLQVALFGRNLRLLEQLRDLLAVRLVAIPVEAGVALVDGTHRLAKGLLEVAAQSHGFTHGFHGRGQRGIGTRELLERETRHLGDHVVDSRFKRGRRRLRDIVLDFVKRITQGKLRGDFSDREARGFRRERGRTGDTRIHFDDDDAASLGVDGELDVAAARVNAHTTDDGDTDVTQLLVFTVGQREGWRHSDGIAGVHANRIDILDRADDHHVVFPVAHQFELEFLPAFDAFFEQHLVGRGIMQTGTGDTVQLFLVMGDA